VVTKICFTVTIDSINLALVTHLDEIGPIQFIFQHLYPKSQIDVYVTILEDDGCTLAAALTVSGLALADAAIQMFDNLVGASVVRI
jgi:hypothetical protein